MSAYDFVHLALHALGGKIQGKTKLQKTMYFLGTLTGHLDDLGYRAHYYGPYSEDVAGAVLRLKVLGFLDLATTAWGTVDGRGFEVSRTDYALNEVGARIAEQKRDAHPELWMQLQKAVAALRAQGDLDYVKLSIAAKAYFILNERGHSSRAGLADIANGFGWNITDDQISEAAAFLHALELAPSSSK